MTTFILTTAARNAAANAVVDLVDGGTGTSGDLAILDGTSVLCAVDLGTVAFGNAATGVASMAATSPTATVTAAGTPDGFQLRNKADTVVASGDAGTASVSLVLTAATLATLDVVTLTSASVTCPAS